MAKDVTRIQNYPNYLLRYGTSPTRVVTLVIVDTTEDDEAVVVATDTR